MIRRTVLVLARTAAVALTLALAGGDVFSAGKFSAGKIAHAAGAAADLPRAPIDPQDGDSLRRGAAFFVNHCMGCHSARHMRYDRMTEDLGISSAQLREHLIFTGADPSAPMLSAMREEDAREWFHQAVPPDLTLAARVRGADWLYAYLRGYYRDASRPTGWNNLVFENTAMPHVLADLQGVAERDAETGALSLARPGRLSAGEYNLMAADLVNFMHYIAEPSRETRLTTGYLVMTFLLVLLCFTWMLYREYWRDVK